MNLCSVRALCFCSDHVRFDALDREEAGDRAGVPDGIVAHRPGDDRLVTDIGVDDAAAVGDRRVDVEDCFT